MTAVPAELTDALSAEDEAEIADEAGAEIEPEEVEAAEEEEAAEPTAEDADEDDRTVSRSELRDLLTSLRGRPEDPPLRPDELVDKLADFFSGKGITVESVKTPEERVILERWRRMAGISWEDDSE